MEHKPRWKKADRIDREKVFELKAAAEEIFPLLCPVREYDWIPDWRCTMIHSDSGVAEKDAVFHTRELFGKRTVWTCITYEPPRLIEYVFVLGDERSRPALDSAGGNPGRLDAGRPGPCASPWRS